MSAESKWMCEQCKHWNYGPRDAGCLDCNRVRQPSTSESRFQRLRRTASELLGSEAVRDAIETTKDVAGLGLELGLDVTTEVASRGGRAVTSLVHGARKTITQEEAWAQMEQSINDLTDVARVQHAMILDLLDRVELLEAATKSKTP